MNWSELLEDYLPFANQNGWILYIFAVVFATLLVNYFETIIYRRLIIRLEQTKSRWDEAMVWAFHKPVTMLIWVMGLTFAAELASAHAPKPQLFDWIGPFRGVSSVLIISWFLLRFVKKFEEIYIATYDEQHCKIDIATARALANLMHISIMITTGLLILQVLDFDLTILFAFGGAGTAIIAFASQDLLANFFGAFIIYLDRPFTVGDWIKSPDRSIEGTVEHIGWRMTRIRTFERRILYVPNSAFTKISVENPSRMYNRRIKKVLGLRYCDSTKLDLVTKDIKNMLLNHPEIDTDKALFVTLEDFGASSLNCLIYTFTKTTAWVPFQEIQQDVLLKILQIVEGHGAEVAFPTRTLEFPSGQEAKALATAK